MKSKIQERPFVTVLMPVYNAEKYLLNSIQSILNQTYDNFEFLIINDGSIDGSEVVIHSFKDRRINYIKNITNMGIVRTLNRGLKIARGKYIVRMDADDISLPERISKQVSYMEKNLDVVVCGAGIRIFTRFPIIGLNVFKPILHENIVVESLFNNVIQHPTAIIRRSALVKHKINYREIYPHAEDYDLWIRLAKIGKLSNLHEVHLNYRYHPGSIGKTYGLLQSKSVRSIRKDYWKSLGLSLNGDQVKLLGLICDQSFTPSPEILKEIEIVLMLFKKQILMLNKYQSQLISEMISKQWYLACSKSAVLGYIAWEIYRKSSIKNLKSLSLMNKLSFMFRCLVRTNDFLIQRKILKWLA